MLKIEVHLLRCSFEVHELYYVVVVLLTYFVPYKQNIMKLESWLNNLTVQVGTAHM